MLESDLSRAVSVKRLWVYEKEIRRHAEGAREGKTKVKLIKLADNFRTAALARQDTRSG